MMSDDSTVTTTTVPEEVSSAQEDAGEVVLQLEGASEDLVAALLAQSQSSDVGENELVYNSILEAKEQQDRQYMGRDSVELPHFRGSTFELAHLSACNRKYSQLALQKAATKGRQPAAGVDIELLRDAMFNTVIKGWAGDVEQALGVFNELHWKAAWEIQDLRNDILDFCANKRHFTEEFFKAAQGNL